MVRFPCRVIPKFLRTVFIASLLNAQHEKNNEIKEPTGLYVVFLGEAFDSTQTAPSFEGRKMVRPSTLPVPESQFDKRQANTTQPHTHE